MHIGTRLAWVGVVLAVAGGACSSPPATPMDGGGSTFPTLPRASTGTRTMPDAFPANYACLRGVDAAEPPAGAVGTYNFDLVGFGSGDAVSDARVYFWPDNRPTPTNCDDVSTCDAATGCQVLLTDAMGRATVMGPAGAWYAYRACPRMGGSLATTYVDSIQINEPGAAAGGSVEGNAVSVGTLNLIPAAYGFIRNPDTAIVAGRVHDCDETPVRGAYVRLFAADGTEYVNNPVDNDAPHIQYFAGDDSTPDGNVVFTQVDGLYAAAQIPPPPAGTDFVPVRAEAWAVLEAGTDPVLVGCESVGVFTNGVSIVNLGPVRSDYPAGHPCEGR